MNEIVLPSGKFARLRPLTALDFLLSQKLPHPEAVLVSLAVTFDDASLTYAEVLELPLEEFMPVMGMLGKVLTKINLKGVS